jgi:hypothetical protein
MDAYYAIDRILLFIAVATQCLFLMIQGQALARYRQHCFTLLFFGAFFGLVYAVLAGLPLFMSFSLPSRIFLLKISTVLATLGATLGILGMVLLLRSYHELAQRVSSDASRKT